MKKNIDSVLQALEVEQNIRKQLFNVVTVPLRPVDTNLVISEYKNQENPIIIPKNAKFEAPQMFSTYKSDGGAPLGTVGKDFRVTQPEHLFNAFLECVSDESVNLDLSTLKYETLKGGAKVRYSVDLEPTVFKNRAKVNDVISKRLIMETGYDGLTANRYFIETLVLKCTNGMTARGLSSMVKYKNTKGNVGKIEFACSQIVKMVSDAKQFGEKMQLFDKTKVTKKQVQEFMSATLGFDVKEREELHKIKMQRLLDMEFAIDKEFSRNGQTAWGLLNAMTYATNHIWAPNANDSRDYMAVGGGLKNNDKAQRFLDELVKA